MALEETLAKAMPEETKHWIEEAANLRKELDHMRSALITYGRHGGVCNTYGGKDCNCGWEKTKLALIGDGLR